MDNLHNLYSRTKSAMELYAQLPEPGSSRGGEMSHQKCLVPVLAALALAACAIGDNQDPTAATPQKISLRASSLTDTDGTQHLAVQFQVVDANHNLIKTIDAAEGTADLTLTPELLAGDFHVAAVAPGYVPALINVYSKELTDMYVFPMQPVQDEQPSQELNLDGLLPARAMALQKPIWRGRNLDPEYPDTVRKFGGRAVVTSGFFARPADGSDGMIVITPALPSRSTDLQVTVFDEATLAPLWEGTVPLNEAGSAILDTSVFRDRSPKAGVWVAASADIDPILNLQEENHTAIGNDCTTYWRACSQQAGYMYGHNACGGGTSATMTLGHTVTVSFGISYQGASVGVSGSVSASFTYTFPANAWMDLYLVVRGCNYRTCGLTYCSTNSIFSSCGNGGVLGCAIYGAGHYAISGPQSCARQWTATHFNTCP